MKKGRLFLFAEQESRSNLPHLESKQSERVRPFHL